MTTPSYPARSLTFSKIVLNWITHLDPNIKTSGFRQELFRIAKSSREFSATDLKDLRSERRYRIIPDAFWADRKHRVMYIFEVEDTHTLKLPKLHTLVDLYHFLEYARWELRIFLIDRYTGNWRTLPLQEVWHMVDDIFGARRWPRINWDEVYDRVMIGTWLFPYNQVRRRDA